jgi:hypothetical protein
MRRLQLQYYAANGFSASEDSADRRMETPGFIPESFMCYNGAKMHVR